MARFVTYSLGDGDGLFGVWTTPNNPLRNEFYQHSYTPVAISINGVSIVAVPPVTDSISWQPVQSGSPIPPTVTLTPPATDISQTGLNINYSAGDDVQQQVTVSSHSTSTLYNIGVSYTPAPPYQNLCLLARTSDTGNGTVGFTSSQLGMSIYMPLNTVLFGFTDFSIEANVSAVWPVAGTFQGMAIVYGTFTGGSPSFPDTYTLSLRKNSVDVWTVTLPGPGSGDQASPPPLIDTTTTVSVSPGDLVNYKITFVNGDVSDTEAGHELIIYSLVLGFRSP
jgi:hypothetical protein